MTKPVWFSSSIFQHSTNPWDRSLFKYIPTEMEWGGTYRGGWASVRLYCNGPLEKGNHSVAISGTDDGCQIRRFTHVDDAIKLYDSLRYIQSHQDLKEFYYIDKDGDFHEVEGADNNGTPSEYPGIIYKGDEFPRWMRDDETPVPWG